MKITNKYGLPEQLVGKVGTTPHNNPGNVSATTLLKGTKEIVLTKRHWESLEDDVSNRVWALFGTATHSLLEEDGETSFSEEFLSIQIGEKKLTGKMDLYDMATKVITDYKTASVWKIKFNDFSDWRRQGLIYDYLCRANGLEVETIRFIALLKDHSKTQAKREAGYPQSPVFVYEVKPTQEDREETEAFIIDKINAIIEAEKLADDEIEPCTESERWAKPSKFAVMKEGRKTAVKLYDNEQDAKAHVEGEGKGFYVEHRKGESTKCEDYCLVKDFCSFYKNMED